MQICAHIVLSGRVQGVGFRWFLQRKATELGLTGYVRNRPDGKVEIEVEGAEDDVEEMIASAKRGPTFARVTDIDVEGKDFTGRYSTFEISH